MKTVVFIFHMFNCFLAFSSANAASIDFDNNSRTNNVKISDLKKIQLTVLDLIAPEYQAERYYFTTNDGYILTIHRLWKKGVQRTREKVVYLQHGILASSSDWIIAGPRKSLGYILADDGYDIWMGNTRGNTYSRNHTTLNPDIDKKFWEFSWHEIGTIDLPQIIDYVLEQTGAESLYYCGHSQGTTVFYVMASEKPEYNKKIKVHLSLAPIGYLSHMKSPLLKLISYVEKPGAVILNALGIGEFLPKKSFLSSITEKMCSNSFSQILCANVLFTLCGYSPQQLNRTLLPLIMTQTPAGASSRQFLHFGQEIASGHFRQYDYGLWGNLKKYYSLAPPDYDLSKITAPVYMIYSSNDLLADENDVRRLCSGIGNCKGKFLVSDYSFNHLDFCFGKDANDLVYRKVLSLFSRH